LEFDPGMTFSFFLSGKRYISRRRRGGNVEIRRFCLWPDFQARWKEWETRCWGFPRFPRGGISTAPFILSFSERSDAAGASADAALPSSLWRLFSFFAPISTSLVKILRQDRPGTTIRWQPDRQYPFLGAQAFFPPRSLRMDSPRISMRWALCTSRSRMLSAKVGSPICSCHWATGSWLVRIVERV